MTPVVVVAASPSSAPAAPLPSPARTLAAQRIVRHHAALCAAASFIPMPIVGSVAITGVQLDMLRDLSRLYGVSFSQDTGRALLASAAGGVLNYYLAQNPLTRAVRDFLNATVPWLAWPLRMLTGPALMAGYTVLLGQAFVRHYEKGGTHLNFNWSDFRRDLVRKIGLPAPASATGGAINVVATVVPSSPTAASS